jgi:hypothetical protein
MSLRGGTTKQPHAIQGGCASVRLPRYARNDIFLRDNLIFRTMEISSRPEVEDFG